MFGVTVGAADRRFIMDARFGARPVALGRVWLGFAGESATLNLSRLVTASIASSSSSSLSSFSNESSIRDPVNEADGERASARLPLLWDWKLVDRLGEPNAAVPFAESGTWRVHSSYEGGSCEMAMGNVEPMDDCETSIMEADSGVAINVKVLASWSFEPLACELSGFLAH